MLIHLFTHTSGIGLLGMTVAIATVAVGLAYAWKPTERRLAVMRPLSLATIFGALCSFTAGVATVLEGIGNTGPRIGWSNVALGASEAFLPLFGAFGCLTVAWLGVAVGFRKVA